MLIGRIGLFCHDDWPLADAPVPEVGWVLHRDWWGRGFATEGGQAGVEAWREHLPDEPRLYSFTAAAQPSLAGSDGASRVHAEGSQEWRGYDTVWYALDRR